VYVSIALPSIRRTSAPGIAVRPAGRAEKSNRLQKVQRTCSSTRGHCREIPYLGSRPLRNTNQRTRKGVGGRQHRARRHQRGIKAFREIANALIIRFALPSGHTLKLEDFDRVAVFRIGMGRVSRARRGRRAPASPRGRLNRERKSDSWLRRARLVCPNRDRNESKRKNTTKIAPPPGIVDVGPPLTRRYQAAEQPIAPQDHA